MATRGGQPRPVIGAAGTEVGRRRMGEETANTPVTQLEGTSRSAARGTKAGGEDSLKGEEVEGGGGGWGWCKGGGRQGVWDWAGGPSPGRRRRRGWERQRGGGGSGSGWAKRGLRVGGGSRPMGTNGGGLWAGRWLVF
jgi:hypothetical protein